MRTKGRYIPIEKRKQIYYAYVHSQIVYMPVIYSEGLKIKIIELQRVQNECTEATYYLPRLT